MTVISGVAKSIVLLLTGGRKEAVFNSLRPSSTGIKVTDKVRNHSQIFPRHQDASIQLICNNIEARPRGPSDRYMLSHHSLHLLWHIKCPNSLCFTLGAYTVTDCSIVSSVLIVLFFPKIERLSWAFVCLQMLSPIGRGSIFGSLTVKVDTIFSCRACTKPARERRFFFFFF